MTRPTTDVRMRDHFLQLDATYEVSIPSPSSPATLTVAAPSLLPAACEEDHQAGKAVRTARSGSEQRLQAAGAVLGRDPRALWLQARYVPCPLLYSCALRGQLVPQLTMWNR